MTVLLTICVRVSSEGKNSMQTFHTMLPQKKMFTSAAAVAFPLAYINGELRLLVLKLACFLTWTVQTLKFIFSAPELIAVMVIPGLPLPPMGSRGRNNKVNKVSSSRWALLDGLRHPYLLLMASVLSAAVFLWGLFYQWCRTVWHEKWDTVTPMQDLA